VEHTVHGIQQNVNVIAESVTGLADHIEEVQTGIMDRLAELAVRVSRTEAGLARALKELKIGEGKTEAIIEHISVRNARDAEGEERLNEFYRQEPYMPSPPRALMPPDPYEGARPKSRRGEQDDGEGYAANYERRMSLL